MRGSPQNLPGRRRAFAERSDKVLLDFLLLFHQVPEIWESNIKTDNFATFILFIGDYYSGKNISSHTGLSEILSKNSATDIKCLRHSFMLEIIQTIEINLIFVV